MLTPVRLLSPSTRQPDDDDLSPTVRGSRLPHVTQKTKMAACPVSDSTCASQCKCRPGMKRWDEGPGDRTCKRAAAPSSHTHARRIPIDIDRCVRRRIQASSVAGSGSRFARSARQPGVILGHEAVARYSLAARRLLAAQNKPPPEISSPTSTPQIRLSHGR
jgi:hypothetical protein